MGARRRGLVRRLGRPAPLPARARGRAQSRSPPSRTAPRRPLRRRRRSARTARGSSASASGTTATAATDVVNEIVVARRPTVPGEPRGAGHRAGLRRGAAAVAGRRHAGLAAVEPPGDAVGRRRAGRRATSPPARRRVVAGGPGESVRRAAVAAATARCGSSPTAPTGGTSTAGSPATTSRPWSAPTPTSACRRGRSAPSRYAVLDDGRVVVARVGGDGFDGLAVRGTDGSLDRPRPARSPPSARSSRPARTRSSWWPAAPTAEPGVHRIDLAGPTPQVDDAARTARPGTRRRRVLVPEAVAFPRSTARASRAPATRCSTRRSTPRFRGPADERPPLLVVIHGGPTGEGAAGAGPSACSTGPAAASRWSTSTTAARRATAAPYRELLRGQWGVVDVDDCLAAARALADRGRVDPARLCIRGGSAGGYTTLAALAGRRRRSRPAPTTSASPTSRRSPATRTSSRAAISTGWSGPTRRRATSTSSARRSPRRAVRPPADRAAGRRGRDRATRPVRDDRRRRCARRACRSPTCSSRASSTASGGPRTSAVRWTPSCRSTRRCSVPPRRGHRAGGGGEPLGRGGTLEA